jgi:hypothetical protein
MASPNRVPSLELLDMVITQARNPPQDLTVAAVANAQVLLYAQGATVAENKFLDGFTPPGPPGHGSEWDVKVHHTGGVVAQLPGGVMGQVWRNGDPAYIAMITKVTQGSPPIVRMYNNSRPGGFWLMAGDRLVVVEPETQWYTDPRGLNGAGNGATTNTQGRVRGYVRDLRYDLLVPSGVADAPRIYQDLVGGFVMRG